MAEQFYVNLEGAGTKAQKVKPRRVIWCRASFALELLRLKELLELYPVLF